MPQVIRFKDLVQMLSPIDWIQIGTEALSYEDMEQLEITNPLVRIEQIKTGSPCGEDYPYGISDTIYTITILHN